MRISNFVAAIENIAIRTGGKLTDATKEFYTEVEQEARARALYKAETRAERNARLIDLRAAVKAVDELHAARQNDEFKAALKAYQSAPKRAKAK
jgi:hypothetical protein